MPCTLVERCRRCGEMCNLERQNAPSVCWYLSTKDHRATFQKAVKSWTSVRVFYILRPTTTCSVATVHTFTTCCPSYIKFFLLEHYFLSRSELKGQYHAPAALPPGQNIRHPLNRRHSGAQRQLGRFSFLFCDATAPLGPRPPQCPGFDITQTHHTMCGASGWKNVPSQTASTWQHITDRQTSMPPAGFENRSGSKWATTDVRLRPSGHCDQWYGHLEEKNALPLPAINRYYQICTKKVTLYKRSSNNKQNVCNNKNNEIIIFFRYF